MNFALALAVAGLAFRAAKGLRDLAGRQRRRCGCCWSGGRRQVGLVGLAPCARRLSVVSLLPKACRKAKRELPGVERLLGQRRDGLFDLDGVHPSLSRHGSLSNARFPFAESTEKCWRSAAGRAVPARLVTLVRIAAASWFHPAMSVRGVHRWSAGRRGRGKKSNALGRAQVQPGGYRGSCFTGKKEAPLVAPGRRESTGY